MANRERREALRGAEEETVDLIAQALSSEQWAELLRAPLERAVAEGNRGLAQKLVRAGAEIGGALHEAARSGNEGIANDLLENGASVAAKDTSREDGDGYTPLHSAAQVGQTEMVQLLLLKGADKDALDNSECTPLYVATDFGNTATAMALLAAGANVSLRCGHSKESVVDMAAQNGLVDILRAAIERGVDLNAADPNFKVAPLHVAALYNEVEVLSMLVEAGANIEARHCDGCTPLHSAACQPNLEAAVALLEYGADANALDCERNTPLHVAASIAGTQSAELVTSLLRSDADETILNDEGKAAVDVVGIRFEETYQLAEDVDRVRELLVNAPADRAWWRRGYLVLCRGFPDRMQQIQDISNAHAGMVRTTRGGAKPGKPEVSGCSGAVETSPVDERGGDWAAAMAMVLGLQEEGIFRTIVGYL